MNHITCSKQAHAPVHDHHERVGLQAVLPDCYCVPRLFLISLLLASWPPPPGPDGRDKDRVGGERRRGRVEVRNGRLRWRRYWICCLLLTIAIAITSRSRRQPVSPRRPQRPVLGSERGQQLVGTAAEGVDAAVC